VREIGRGGMGVVYEALQQHPRRSVAVKVLHPLFASPSSVRRLEREAEILARFQHPGIAQIFDAGSFEGAHGVQPYLVMELVDGGDLATFVHRNALDARRKVELVVAICDAIGHAHERDVVHRDLKPGNILVDARGSPKVLDFGVARSLDADVQRTTMSTESGSIVGTLAYMSPEQVLGDLAAIDARSDVYALGAVLFELLTGRLPILVDGLSFARAIQAVRDDEPLPLSALDRALRGDPRDHRRQGARERARSTLRERARARGGLEALPRERADRRAPADHDLPLPDVRASPARARRRHRHRVRFACRRRGRDVREDDRGAPRVAPSARAEHVPRAEALQRPIRARWDATSRSSICSIARDASSRRRSSTIPRSERTCCTRWGRATARSRCTRKRRISCKRP
jgi:serine/threonine protein kinase